jgi:hypothetical protein
MAFHETVAAVLVMLDAATEVGACADEPWLATILIYP